MGMKTTKEKVLMLVLGLVVVAAIWYLLFLTPTQDEIVKLQQEQEDIKAQDDQVLSQIAVFKKWQEQLGLDLESDKDDFTKIADYNNLPALTDELNQIFVPADTYNLSFQTPQRGEKYYRRNISVSYTAPSYEVARSILEALDSMEHGCYISNVNIDSEGTTSLSISVFEYFVQE